MALIVLCRQITTSMALGCVPSTNGATVAGYPSCNASQLAYMDNFRTVGCCYSANDSGGLHLAHALAATCVLCRLCCGFDEACRNS